jgi:hypothetical protein
MYIKKQYLPLDLFKQFNNIKIDKFSKASEITISIGKEELIKDIYRALKNKKNYDLLITIIHLFSIRLYNFPEIIIDEKDLIKEIGVEFKKKIATEAFIKTFNSSINLKELDKYLEILESSKYVLKTDSLNIVSNTLIIIYKYFYLQFLSQILWNDSDFFSRRKKYSFHKIYLDIQNYNNQEIRNKEGAKNNLIFNLNSTLETNDNLYATIKKIKKSLNWKQVRRDLWLNLTDSVVFTHNITPTKKSTLLRPFYYYLLKVSKEVESNNNIINENLETENPFNIVKPNYDHNNIETKLYFRTFKLKIRKKLY